MSCVRSIVLIIFLLSSFALPAAAASGDPELLSQIGGPVQAVAMRGGYAYVGIGPRLAIVSIAKPGRPVVVGWSAPLPGMVADVALGAGDPPAYAYLAVGPAGVIVVDVSAPTRPRMVGQLDTAGEAADLVLVGDLAYLADWNAGLAIINVADPAHPQLLAQLATGRLARSVAASGHYAYVADASIFGSGSALKVINVTNPVSPTLTATLPIGSGQARGVAVSGQTAYIANGDGLLAINISNPAQPTQVGACALPGFSADVALADGYAFVAAWDGGLHAVNIADPAHPALADSLDTDGNALKVAVSGGLACIADQKALRVVSISDPAALTDPAGPRELGALQMTGTTRGVALVGNRAYIAETPRWVVDRWVGGGLRVLDITDSAAITTTGALETGGNANDIAVAGDYAYLAHGAEGLRIVNVANPAAPVEVGALDTPNDALAIAMAGTVAYVADVSGGLRVISVANPAAPVEIGSFVGANPFYDVALVGNRAYIAAGNGGLRILDITDPTQPRELGVCPIDGWATAVAVVGNRAYVAAGNGGLCIANITHPTAAVPISYLDMEEALSITVLGDYAYIADAPGWDGEGFVGGGLRIINIADDQAPHEASFFDTPGAPRQAAIASGERMLAYVADGESGLRALDVTYPETPAQIAPPLPGLSRRVTIAGNLAYVADQEQGLRVLDISNRSRPAEVGRFASWAMDVAVDGARAFLVDQAGLRLLHVGDPAHPLLLTSVLTDGQATSVKVASGMIFVGEASVRSGNEMVGGGLHIYQLDAGLSEISYLPMSRVEGLAVSGYTVYLAAGSDGLRMVNISNLEEPAESGAFTLTPAYDVVVSGSLAYLATGDGLTIVNVSDPAAPALVGSYAASGNSKSLCLSESLPSHPYVYLADGAGGLHIINVSNPANPTLERLISAAGKPQGVATLNGLLYVADEAGGLATYMPFPQHNILPLLMKQHQ